MATGRNELPAHAALLDPVAFHNTFHRSSIVPCGQSGHHAFPHRSLQFPVLLQLTVALQFHFLALAGSYPRSFQRDLLSSKDHITRLLSPAQTASGGIRPMRRSHPVSYFVFQNGSQDLQSSLPGQLFHLRLHLGPHLGHRQRHPHQQLLPSHDLELVIGLALFPLVILFHGGSLLDKGILSPNSIRVRARAAASCSQVSTKPGASSEPAIAPNAQAVGPQKPVQQYYVEDGGAHGGVLESIVIPPKVNAPFTLLLQTEWVRI